MAATVPNPNTSTGRLPEPADRPHSAYLSQLRKELQDVTALAHNWRDPPGGRDPSATYNSTATGVTGPPPMYDSGSAGHAGSRVSPSPSSSRSVQHPHTTQGSPYSAEHSPGGRPDASAQRSPRGSCVVEVTVEKGQDIPKADLIGATEAFVGVRMTGREWKYTETKQGSNVEWNETFRLPLEGDSLELVLMDKDTVGSDDVLGQGVVQLSSLPPGRAAHLNVPMLVWDSKVSGWQPPKGKNTVVSISCTIWQTESPSGGSPSVASSSVVAPTPVEQSVLRGSAPQQQPPQHQSYSSPPRASAVSPGAGPRKDGARQGIKHLYDQLEEKHAQVKALEGKLGQSRAREQELEDVRQASQNEKQVAEARLSDVEMQNAALLRDKEAGQQRIRELLEDVAASKDAADAAQREAAETEARRDQLQREINRLEGTRQQEKAEAKHREQQLRQEADHMGQEKERWQTQALQSDDKMQALKSQCDRLQAENADLRQRVQDYELEFDGIHEELDHKLERARQLY